MTMTAEQYGEAIRAAYAEGWRDGGWAAKRIDIHGPSEAALLRDRAWSHWMKVRRRIGGA